MNDLIPSSRTFGNKKRKKTTFYQNGKRERKREAKE